MTAAKPSPFSAPGINIDRIHGDRRSIVVPKRYIEVPNKVPEYLWEDGTPKSLNNVFNWRNVK